LFRFTLRDSIFEWGENYVQDPSKMHFWKVGTNILQVI
jgi:hypothetical protein